MIFGAEKMGETAAEENGKVGRRSELVAAMRPKLESGRVKVQRPVPDDARLQPERDGRVLQRISQGAVR